MDSSAILNHNDPRYHEMTAIINLGSFMSMEQIAEKIGRAYKQARGACLSRVSETQPSLKTYIDAARGQIQAVLLWDIALQEMHKIAPDAITKEMKQLFEEALKRSAEFNDFLQEVPPL